MVDTMATAIEIVLKLVLVLTYHEDLEGLREILSKALTNKDHEIDILMEIMAKRKDHPAADQSNG